jgi:hypothetical protein
MTYRSKIAAVAGLVVGLAFAGAPAHAQQPGPKQAAPAPAPAPALKTASPAALAAAKEILTMKNANAMYASAVPNIVDRPRTRWCRAILIIRRTSMKLR